MVQNNPRLPSAFNFCIEKIFLPQHVQGPNSVAQKSKPLRNYQKIVLNSFKACQCD